MKNEIQNKKTITTFTSNNSYELLNNNAFESII